MSRHSGLRSSSPPGQRHDRRRRLRARARLRRDLPDRRPLVGGEPARGPAARRAARRRRPHPPDPQAPRPPRSRRRLLHAGRGRARAARARVAAHRRTAAKPAAVRADGQGARARGSPRKRSPPQDATEGVALHAARRARSRRCPAIRYAHVDVRIDRRARTATITVAAPANAPPAADPDAILAAGASWWPLAMARELDDAILLLRTNELDSAPGSSGP